MADPRNIKILGTVEATSDASIILSGSNTYIKKILDDGTVLFQVGDSEVAISGNLMLSASLPLNNVPLTNDGMYNAETAIRVIDQSIETKAAKIRAAYEAVRFRHFGTLSGFGTATLNLTQLSTSGSEYFNATNIKDITVDLLVDTNGDGIYRNDLASIHLFTQNGDLIAQIEAPSAVNSPYRFIAVNETLLDVINTSASYNVPGITTTQLSGALSPYATISQLSGALTASNIANFTENVRSQFTAGDNISINNGIISATITASGDVTAAQLTSALSPYVTSTNLNNTLSSYATLTGVTGALTSYATLTGVSSSFVNLSTNENISGIKTFSNGLTSSKDILVNNISIGRGNLGLDNIAIGLGSLISNSSGIQNVTLGSQALNKLTVGSANIALGVNAGQNLTEGNYNVMIGPNTGPKKGGYNIAVGEGALSLYQDNLGGYNFNIAIGANAGYSLSGSNEINNIFIGKFSGYNLSKGKGCVIIGGSDGTDINNTTGSIILSDGFGNIRLRANNAGLVTIPGSLTVSGNVTLGDASADSITLNAATMSLGSGTGILNIDSNTFYVDGANNRIGIGKTNPTVPLDVNGNMVVTGTVSITTAMQLSAQNPLPAGSIGMMAVSGTNLYFHNGTAWTMII